MSTDRLATQTVISFLKAKFPSMANDLDGLIEDGDVSKPAGGMSDRVRESVEGIFGKKTV